MSEIRAQKKDSGGGAGWIMTFADLMSLLMCFFVLLLSFAELDILKFKQIAGSMKFAFGIQREIKATEIPKGTSIIAQEYSAGKPQPTVLDEVRQQTIDEDKQSLEFTDALTNDPEGTNPSETGGQEQRDERQTAIDAEQLLSALSEEVEKGMIQIETEGTSIVIRIREKGSFPSGTARFDPQFRPVLSKLRAALRTVDGQIAVAGHTDNIPISTRLYRSNWDLASARAVSVVHALLEGSELEPERFVAEGHGDAHPLVKNDSLEHRALNRRVEITIRKAPRVSAMPEEAVSSLGPFDAAVDGFPASAETAVPDDSGLPDWVPRAEAVAPDSAEQTRPPSRIDQISAGIRGQ